MCWVKLTAIVSVTGLMAYALHLGFNGLILTAVIAAISGIAGYEFHVVKERK